MIAGTREVATSNSMRHDPLYAYAKAFTEACNSILTTERYDIFQEPARAMRSEAVQEAMKEFFCNEVADETEMDAEDLEKCKENILFRNPKAKIIPICAKTGEGMQEWADWLSAQIDEAIK